MDNDNKTLRPPKTVLNDHPNRCEYFALQQKCSNHPIEQPEVLQIIQIVISIDHEHEISSTSKEATETVIIQICDRYSDQLKTAI